MNITRFNRTMMSRMATMISAYRGVRDVTRIGRIFRRISTVTITLGLVAVTGLGGTPAQAVSGLNPRSEEWWFTAWDIQNQVWNQTTGRGITVAVLDSGVNARLPELSNVVVPGTDKRLGGSGDGLTDVDDAGGHGTGMAALIAGQGGPSGMVGIAPDAKILPIVTTEGRVAVGEPAHGGGPATDLGIRYAADHGAQVIDVSLVGPYPGGCTDTDQEAVSYAIDKGSVVVAAAGDTGYAAEINDLQNPSSCAGVLAVGAVTNQKLAWTRTQRQDYVSVGAPGVGVGLLMNDGTVNGNLNGTGQASSLAAGGVALIRSKFPRLSPREVVQLVINTTVDAGPPGPDNMTGAGVMVPIRSLTQNVPRDAPNPTFDRLDAWRAQNPTLANPSPTQAGPPTTPQLGSGQSQKDSGSSLGLGGWLAIAAIFLAVVVIVVIAGVTRRRRPVPQPMPQQPFPNGLPSYPHQGQPMSYGGPQHPGGQWQGQPPSYGSPTDPGAPPR